MLPVIFLAFANDKQRQAHYLESVTKEKNAIDKALANIKGKLCEVIVETDISIGKIWEIFQSNTYRDRICIFHFGGHADGFQLLLETWEGKNEIALGDGLVSFLSNQKSLQLIFLNGCSTKELVVELTNKGIPAAIGTTQSIYDTLAAELAPNFYQALAQGIPLQRAWLETIDQLNTKRGEVINSNFRGIVRNQNTEEKNNWFLQFHAGAEQAKSWNLPDAANNPLFGLELPKKYLWSLPLEPYKGLNRFQKADAGIFFGRGAEIRQLFQSIKGDYPVILFYGESGVGKSSLLEAGLLPRIEEYYKTVYVRRNEEIGLSTILDKALQDALEIYANNEAHIEIVHDEKLERITKELESLANQAQSAEIQSLMNGLLKEYAEKQMPPKSSSLLQKWFNLENTIESKKPLIIILDQVEEVFTKPIKSAGEYDELKILCQEIKDLFITNDKLKGKIVLSFRKEYQAEIEAELGNFMIPFTKVFLGALNRQGVMEAVNGINTNEYAANNYYLKIEEKLPGIIANKIFLGYDQNDLSNGPIAPVLQLVLKKMWEEIQCEKERVFTKQLYDRIGGLEGLEEFLTQVIQKIQAANKYKNFVESGALHEALLYFVTDRMTAAQYQQIKVLETFPSLKVPTLTELLNDLQTNQILYSFEVDGLKWLRLIHDSLAPVIKKLHEQSDYPIQKLSRILHTNMQNQNLLTPDDLIYFEEWKDWYRVLSKEEELFIKNSKFRNTKSLVKYYIKQNKLELALGWLLNENSHRIDRKHYFQLELIRSKNDHIQLSVRQGIFSFEEHLLALEQIRKEFLYLVDVLRLNSPQLVLVRVQELKLLNLMQERKTDELLKQISTLLKELDEEELLIELISINSRFLGISKMIRLGIISEENADLEVNRILLALGQVCREIGNKYQLDNFKALLTPENPIKLMTLEELDKFPLELTNSEPQIEAYFFTIRDLIGEGKIEKALLKYIDLAGKLQEYGTKAQLLEIEKKWTEFKTSEMLGVISYGDLSVMYAKIIYEILKIKNKYIGYGEEKRSILKQSSPQLLSTKETISSIRDAVLNKQLDFCFSLLRQILGTHNELLIAWYFRLFFLYAAFRNKFQEYKDLDQTILFDGILLLLDSWESQLENEKKSSDCVFESGVLLSKMIRFFMMRGFNHEPFFSPLEYWFDNQGLVKYKLWVDNFAQLNSKINHDSRLGLVDYSVTSRNTAQINTAMLFLGGKINSINKKYYLFDEIGDLQELTKMVIYAQEQLNLFDFKSALNHLHHFAVKIKIDSLKNFIDGFTQTMEINNFHEEKDTVSQQILLLFCEWLLSNLNRNILLEPDQVELKKRILQCFYNNKFEEIMEVLSVNFASDEIRSRDLDDFYLKFEDAEFEEIMGNDEPMNDFRFEILTYINNIFSDIQQDHNIPIDKIKIDKLDSDFKLWMDRSGRSKLIEFLYNNAFVEMIDPKCFFEFQLLSAKIEALEKNHRNGLISSLDWIEQLFELKKATLDNFLQFRESIEAMQIAQNAASEHEI